MASRPQTKTSAATIPARLAIEPTLRSKSPIAITTVIVEETTASMLICCVMLRRFREVRNVSGSRNQKKAITAAKPISVPYRRRRSGILASACRLAVAKASKRWGERPSVDTMAATRPSRMTTTREHRRRISSWSEETTMMPVPCAAKSRSSA